ncbi:uncharacterized protein PG998_004486 [Apiospora kogelbergensis]|uniref:uncharacterized protein n=1 Tax=Apiospora kogelbergensis TaxID=1337665 RepID=UPI00312D6F43
MTTGAATTPPAFTPAPDCMESLSHLYRVTLPVYSTSCNTRYSSTCSSSTRTAQICTPLATRSSCAYYNLGYDYYGARTCAPNSLMSSASYSGCPVGYTTACAATSSRKSVNTPYWPSTEIKAICCPTHSVYTFTCEGLPASGATAASTSSSSPTYDDYFAWETSLNTAINGCVAPVTAAAAGSAPDAAAVTVEVLSASIMRVEMAPTTWTNYRGETVSGRSWTTEQSTATSTATLTPGVDWVSAKPVGISMTVWDLSTCFPGGGGRCQTPAPMWGSGGLYGLSNSKPTHAPWPVTPKYGSTGTVSVILLCFVSIGFFVSVCGFWRKGRRMSERRADIRLELVRAQRAHTRQYDTYYGQ